MIESHSTDGAEGIRLEGRRRRKPGLRQAVLRASRVVLALIMASYVLSPGSVSALGLPTVGGAATGHVLGAASGDGAGVPQVQDGDSASLAAADSSTGDDGASGSGGSGGDSTSGGGTGGGSGSGGTTTAYDVGFYLFFENSADPQNPISVNEVTPRIIDAAGSLQLYAQAEIASTGDIDWAGNLSVNTAWSIEETYDEDGNLTTTQLATIDRGEGVLRALGQGNGSVKVRCTAMSPYNGFAETIVQIQGNSGVPYVTDLQICDDAGNIIADDSETRIESGAFGFEKHFYARATYVDPITGETFVKDTHAGDVIPGIKWTVSGDSGVCYVNPDTGVVVPQKTGTVMLACSIAGAGQLGDTIEDRLPLLLGGDSLDRDQRDYNPVDYVKVVVKYAAEDKSNYASREDYDEARTWYYTIADLEALGTVTNHYTLVKRDGNWDRMDAYGIYLQQLIDDQNLDDDDIDGFYFHANDAANSGYLSFAWVFNANRYYFPNMGIGSGLLDARQVAPMLATKTTQITSGSGLDDIDVSTLSDQTRVRLCLGAESPTSNNAQKSLYNLDEITIILAGAPPSHWDNPEHGSSTQPGGKDNGGGDNKKDDDNGGGDKKDDHGDNGGDNNNGGGDNGGGKTGPDDNAIDSGNGPDSPSSSSNTNSASNVSSSSSANNTSNSSQSASDSASRQSAQQASADAGTSDDAAGQEKKSWQIYEMMRADDPNVDALDIDNPYVPWAIALLAGTALAAVGVTVVGYRRQLVSTVPGRPSASAGA